MSPRLLAPVLLLAGLLGGCSGDEGSTEGGLLPGTGTPTSTPADGAPTSLPVLPTGSPAASASPSPSAADPSVGPAAEGPTSPVQRPGANTAEATGPATGSPDGTVLLEAVRLAPQDGFDRLVFAFRGDATPEYVARYVEPPVTADGSGDPVEVRGGAFLSITMIGASGVDMSGPEFQQVYPGPRRLSAAGLGAVQEVVETGDFEATLTWVLGVDSERPFTVRSLAGPGRLVLDVRTG